MVQQWKALVIEPDAKTSETIDDILTTLPLPCDTADCLAQALRLLDKDEYSLMLPAFDMPSRTGSKPRPKNAEHFMLSLQKARSRNMPKVIMLISESPAVSDEDVVRWAFDMGDMGVSGVVRKPLLDEGRTLDRVIKKVISLNGKAAGAGIPPPQAAGSPAPAPQNAAGGNGTAGWLTVTEAAARLVKDLPGLDNRKARSPISTAAGRKEFKTTGARKGRRVEPHTFDSWRLKQRD